MSDKMIEVCGQKYSEGTIKEALKKYSEFKEEPRWVAAIAGSTRLIINLARLSENAKDRLFQSLQRKDIKWISIDEKGCWGAACIKDNGLVNYDNTKIIFGE